MKKMSAFRIAIITFFCLLLIRPILAADENWYWRDSSGAKVDDKPNMKAKNGFGAQVLITDDKDYLKKWKEQPSAGPFYIHAVNAALRNKPIFVLIIFANPGVDEKGLCNITADVTITKPDGIVRQVLKDGDCWKDMPAPPKGNIQLSKVSIGYSIDETDPSGRYIVNALIKDRVKGVELQLSDYFNAK